MEGQGRTCQKGLESDCESGMRIWKSKRGVLTYKSHYGTSNSTSLPTSLSLSLPPQESESHTLAGILRPLHTWSIVLPSSNGLSESHKEHCISTGSATPQQWLQIPLVPPTPFAVSFTHSFKPSTPCGLAPPLIALPSIT